MEIHPIPSFANEELEIIADGNVEGDNDNWRWKVVGQNLELQVKISGTWVWTEKHERRVT